MDDWRTSSGRLNAGGKEGNEHQYLMKRGWRTVWGGYSIKAVTGKGVRRVQGNLVHLTSLAMQEAAGVRLIERLPVSPREKIPRDYLVGFRQVPFSPVRFSRRWDVRASISSGAEGAKEDASVGKDKESGYEASSERVERPITIDQTRAESADPEGDFPEDSETNAMGLAGKSSRDDIALNISASFQRVKSSGRLTRQSSDDSSGDPLLGNGDSRLSSSSRQSSFREDVGHAAAETFLLTRLTFNLLRYLGVGYRWITRLLALFLYAMFLTPGFLQVGWQYFFSKHIHRSIVYGDQPRNRLDLYLPENTSIPRPVVIFVTGGAWIIGYKAWGALLGLQLLDRDIIVCCIDYRNFPQGGVSDMVKDVTTGIGFVVDNIVQYGGDPNRVYLAGQSAGSHLAACALVHQAQVEIGQREGFPTWKCSSLKAFLGISGGYNLPNLVDHFDSRGLYRSLFLKVMEGEDFLPYYSPEMLVRNDAFTDGVRLLPPMYLFHGTADYSIPYNASVDFGKTLSAVGATVTTRFYPDKTHTDVFLQDPMRGGHDPLFEDILAVIHADDAEAKARDAQAPLRPRLVPEFLLQLAHNVSPF